VEQIYADMYGSGSADPGVWVCADGTEIRVEDMSDAHLHNVKRLLERANAKRIHSAKCAMFNIDDAQWIDDEDIGDFHDPIDEIWPVYATVAAKIRAREERMQPEVVLFCNDFAGGYTTLLV
jgi:hypothetical protein